MAKFELKVHPWGDEYTYNGNYITILADGKEIWESIWCETGYPSETNELRADVKDRLDNLIEPVKYDISSYDVYEWKILND
jgi:hypothetical protein